MEGMLTFIQQSSFATICFSMNVSGLFENMNDKHIALSTTACGAWKGYLLLHYLITNVAIRKKFHPQKWDTKNKGMKHSL